MHIALWIVQGLLAAAFVLAGATKLFTPIDELLANGMTFVAHMPPEMVRFIGLAELAGAVGLILPAATRIKPIVTALAAALLSVGMFLAICTHVFLGEWGAVLAPLVLGALALFVAWGRRNRAVIEERPKRRGAARDASPRAA